MRERPAVWPVFLVFVVVFAGTMLLGSLLFAVWGMVSTGFNDPEPVGPAAHEVVVTPSALAAAVGITSFCFGGSALLCALLTREPLRERLRLRAPARGGRAFLLVALGLLGTSFVLDAVIRLFGLDDRGMLQLMTRAMAQARGATLVLLVVTVGFLAGSCEELFFRGFMQTPLSRRWGALAAVAVTAACFGLVHLDLVHTPSAAVLGIFLGWAAERTGSILPSIAAHVVNNLVAIVTARYELPNSAPVQVAVLAAAVVLAVASVVGLARSYRPAPVPASL